jgi:hypothetical protein
MTQKTRGSAALDKAQRRLAQLKSIDENLDLGLGLTIATYTQSIDSTRATLEAHNTLLSNLAESRQKLAQLDSNLSDLSERMLRGVAIRYGKNSVEYAKAGGSNRKKGGRSTRSTTMNPMIATTAIAPAQATALNGNGAQPVLN